MQNQPVKSTARFFEVVSFELLVTGCLFVGAVFLFGVIMRDAVFEHAQAFDNDVFAFFGAITTPALVSTMKFFTFFGSSPFMISAYVVLVSYFLFRRQLRFCLHIVILALSSTGLMFAIKDFTHRARPELPLVSRLNNFSFPSGHTLSAFIFFSILVYMVIKSRRLVTAAKWVYSTFFILLALTVGVSRIVLKVHYPTDVAASLCLGVAWVTMSFAVLRKISRNEPSLPRDAPEKETHDKLL